MSLDSQIEKYPSVAVFCRNHTVLLEEAVQISFRNPHELVLFRARTVWRAADIALARHGPRPIYLLPIAANDVRDGRIRYVGKLHQVVLRPSDTEATRELLDKSVPAALNEGLWPDKEGNPTVRTLYLVSNIRRVPENTKVHYYDLKKVADGEPIEAEFRYSYCIVLGHPDLNTPWFPMDDPGSLVARRSTQ